MAVVRHTTSRYYYDETHCSHIQGVLIQTGAESSDSLYTFSGARTLNMQSVHVTSPLSKRLTCEGYRSNYQVHQTFSVTLARSLELCGSNMYTYFFREYCGVLGYLTTSDHQM
jgi:hypothetical protein